MSLFEFLQDIFTSSAGELNDDPDNELGEYFEVRNLGNGEYVVEDHDSGQSVYVSFVDL